MGGVCDEGADSLHWILYFVCPLLAAGDSGADTAADCRLLSLPLRLIGISVEAVFGLIRGVVLLPARVLDLARRDGKRAKAT